MMGACQAGGGPGAGGEARRGHTALVVSVVTRGSVMGGAARRTHRAAVRGVFDAVVLASGEMNGSRVDSCAGLVLHS